MSGLGERNSYLYARKTFKLDSQPFSGLVKATADSGYKLFVNGEYVGQGPARSSVGVTYFDTFDVSGLLRKGTNAVALLVHHVGEGTYGSRLAKPGLLCKVEIETKHGCRVIFSDESWRVRAATDRTSLGDRISKGLGFQEVYDSSLRIDRWTQPTFSDQDWSHAEVVGVPPDMPWGIAVPRPIPNLQEQVVYPAAVVGTFDATPFQREFPASDTAQIMASLPLAPLKSGSVKHAQALLLPSGQTEIRTRGDGSGVAILLDFGREVSGYVEVGILKCGQGVVDLGYSEILENHHIRPDREEARYTDRILLSKGGFEWQSFETRAFRYLQIVFRRLTRPLVIEYVRVREAVYPFGGSAEFSCDDELLNRIWRSGAETARLCTVDAFIDSPRLERAQWWGDARIISRTVYYAYGDTRLLAHGLSEFAKAQRKDGMIPALCPAGEEKTVPDVVLMWVFSLLDYYAFSGERALIRELYPSARRLMAWFSKHTDSDGLLCDVPGSVFIDWISFSQRGNLTALNCLWHGALRVMAVLASVLGRQKDFEEFAANAKALRLAINKRLYCPNRGLYAHSRENGVLIERFDPQTNTLAALCEVADQYQRASIIRWVLKQPPEQIPTPYFASLLLEALYGADRHEDALDYIRQRWGPMVSEAPGTLWEDFAGQSGRCHGWATSPTRDLLAEYVGIKPAVAANRFSISPHTGGLSRAKGSIPTAAGRLSVEWKKSRNQFVLRVDVPAGLRVDVYAPGPPQSSVIVNGRAHTSRLVTLTSGSHQIKVVEPRQVRAPRVTTVEPVSIQQVEVLGVGPQVPAKKMLRSAAERKTAGQEAQASTAGENMASIGTPQPAGKSFEPGADEPKPRRRSSRQRPSESTSGTSKRKKKSQSSE